MRELHESHHGCEASDSSPAFSPLWRWTTEMKLPVNIGDADDGLRDACGRRRECSTSVRCYVAHSIHSTWYQITPRTSTRKRTFDHPPRSSNMSTIRASAYNEPVASSPKHTACERVCRLAEVRAGAVPRCAKIAYEDAGSMGAYMSLYVRLTTPNPRKADKSRLAGSSATLRLALRRAGRSSPEAKRVCAPVEWRVYSNAAAELELACWVSLILSVVP